MLINVLMMSGVVLLSIESVSLVEVLAEFVQIVVVV